MPEGPVAVGLTGGTTTSEVARLLVERTDLTVVTNALNIAAESSLRPRLKLVVTGGVSRSQSYEPGRAVGRAHAARGERRHRVRRRRRHQRDGWPDHPRRGRGAHQRGAGRARGAHRGGRRRLEGRTGAARPHHRRRRRRRAWSPTTPPTRPRCRRCEPPACASRWSDDVADQPSSVRAYSVAVRNTNPAPARPSRRSRALRLSLGAVVALTAGCSGASSTPGAAVTSTTSVRPAAAVDTAPTWQAPPANARFDYQIGGAYTPLASVRVVSRDRDDDPVPGRYNICYVNAFQTQPDDAAWWKQHHPDLVLRKASGGVFTDPDWPGEMLLDTRTAAKRARLLQVVGPWFDGCRTSGYQAVEPDNLDTWTRSGKPAHARRQPGVRQARGAGPRQGDGDRPEERRRADGWRAAHRGVRLRDRRGVPGVRGVRALRSRVRAPVHRDRVHRQRHGRLRRGVPRPRCHDVGRPARP
nr:endo alpha-1,4 polygalactosaminidase [Angustibacter aerolatus]